jgi:hypothetical protein
LFQIQDHHPGLPAIRINRPCRRLSLYLFRHAPMVKAIHDFHSTRDFFTGSESPKLRSRIATEQRRTAKDLKIRGSGRTPGLLLRLRASGRLRACEEMSGTKGTTCHPEPPEARSREAAEMPKDGEGTQDFRISIK